MAAELVSVQFPHYHLPVAQSDLRRAERAARDELLQAIVTAKESGTTITQIAAAVGLSRTRVNQILNGQ